MFDKLKDLWKLKAQMDEIKKELDAMSIETESGPVKITISGSQEVREIKFNRDIGSIPSAELEKALRDAVNRAVKDSQQAAAKKMGALTGLGLPGM